MKTWKQALSDASVPGILAGGVISLMAAYRGRKDTGSAVAPINAPSHVMWGDSAIEVTRATVKHTLPGVVINGGAGVFWAALMEKFAGRAIERRGIPAAAIGGLAVSSLAYVTDYHLIPRRLSPGFERRVSRRSLLMMHGAFALALAAGSLLRLKRG